MLGRVTFLVVVPFLFSDASPVRKAENCCKNGTGAVVAGAVVVVVEGTAPRGSVICGAVVVVVVGATARHFGRVVMGDQQHRAGQTHDDGKAQYSGDDAGPCTRRLRVVHQVSRFRSRRTVSVGIITTIVE